MELYQAICPVELMAKTFEGSESGFYKWRQEAENRASKAEARRSLTATIKAVFKGSGDLYGSPVVTSRLQRLGFKISRRTVARNMRAMSLKSKLKRKFKTTTDSNHKLPIAPNHLMQDFKAYRPNQLWMSDITYIPTKEGWLYLCAIIDLYSKKIVGYKLSSRMTQDIVVDPYLSARKSRKPPNWLVFHSDRGSQYASHAFRGLLKKDLVIQSMSRRDCCWDSAPIESLWGRLKTEEVFWENYATRQDATMKIEAWIEKYNRFRPHSALNYESPAETESKFSLASGVA